MQNHRAKNSSSDFWNPELYVDWNWFQIFKNLYVEQKQGGKEGGGGLKICCNDILDFTLTI